MPSLDTNNGTMRNTIRFDRTPEELLTRVEEIISTERAFIDSIALEPSPTFANVVAPLNTLIDAHKADYYFIMFINNVNDNLCICDASEKCIKLYMEFEAECRMRKDVYETINTIYENKDEMEKLCPEDMRLVETMLNDYCRAGVLLLEKEREQLSMLKRRLVELKMKFSLNVDNHIGKVLFTRKELDGMSEDYLNTLSVENVNGQTKFVVTTKYPDYYPLLKYAKHEGTRKALYLAENTRCPENIKLLQEIVKLRHKKAKLLGYTTHSEYILKNRMAKSPEAVLAMENDLRRRLTPLGKQELAKLEKLKKADSQKAGKYYKGFFQWDRHYYTNLLSEQMCNIKSEIVSEYFSITNVTRGIFDIFQQMLGITIKKVENPPVWHDDVDMFEVWEADRKKFVGHFYLDLYPRNSKFSHAACFPLRPGYKRIDGTREFPAAAMVANFPRSSSNVPSLLSHDDVEVFVHELGHVFHNLCSNTRWSQFNADKVEWDFIETPSQMLEQWMWEPAVLRRFATHYKTGDPIPENMINQLIVAKNIDAGLVYLRQVFFGLFDLAIYHNEDNDVDVNALYNTMLKDIGLIGEDNAKTFGAATFEHVVERYDSQYYGYLWSKSFSIDMYVTRFQKEGIDNPKTGADYRKNILHPGGIRDAFESMVGFLGRKPNNDAFLRSIGLTD